MAFRKGKQLKGYKQESRPMYIVAGMYAGKGKQVGRAVVDLKKLKEAINNAASDTEVPGKVLLNLIESKFDGQIGFVSFSGMLDYGSDNWDGGKKFGSKNPVGRRQETEWEDEECDQGDEVEEW